MAVEPVAAPPVAAKPARYFYGWNIVAASFLSNMLTAGGYWQGFQVFFLPLLQEFGWSRASLSLAFSFRSLETGVGAPLVGLLVDRFGPRRVLLGSALAVGLGMFLVGFTWDIVSFYAFFILASFGASGTSHAVSWSVVMARWFRRRRGTALGIGMSGPTLSGIVLIILQQMVEQLGWRSTIFVVGVVLAVVIFPLAWFVVRDTPQEMGMLPDGDLAPAPIDAVKAPTHGTPAAAAAQPHDAGDVELTVGQALRTRNFWLLVLIFSCILFGHSGIQVHQIAFFHNDVGLSEIEATSLLGGVFLVSVIGRIGAGMITDRVDPRYVLAGMVALNVTAWVYINFAPISSALTALPFVVLYGIPFGATVSIRPVLMARLFGPKAMGSLVGLFQAFVLVSTLVGPVFMGYVYDTMQTYRPSLMVFIVSSALALPFAFMMRTRQQPHAGPTV